MIDDFSGKYRFLSNFYDAPVFFEGLMYRNSEGAYQSAKTKDIERRKQFCELDPSKAKRKGRSVILRHDWDDVKDEIMEVIVRDKFTRNESLGERLLATGDQELVEGNTWGDTYWGVCRGRGKNKLGKILMKIRKELREMK